LERERQLDQLVGEFVARAGAGGFDAGEVIDRLRELVPAREKKVR
jgi:hypothetical protein